MTHQHRRQTHQQAKQLRRPRWPCGRKISSRNQGKLDRGLLGSKPIKWNFTKFFVGKDGNVLTRYAPTDTPVSMTRDIEPALAA